MSKISSNALKYQTISQNINNVNRPKTTKKVKYVQYQPGDEKIKYDGHLVQYLNPIEISSEEDLSKLLNGGLTLPPKAVYNESRNVVTPKTKSPKDNYKKKSYAKIPYTENNLNISQQNNEKLINDFYAQQNLKNQQLLQKRVITPKMNYIKYNTIENIDQQNLNISQNNSQYLYQKNNIQMTPISNSENKLNTTQSFYKDEEIWKNSNNFINNQNFEKINVDYGRPTMMTKTCRIDTKQQIYKNISPFVNYKQKDLSNLEINYQQQPDINHYNKTPVVNKNNNIKKRPIENNMNGHTLSESIDYILQNKKNKTPEKIELISKTDQKISKKNLSTSKNKVDNYYLINPNISRNKIQFNENNNNNYKTTLNNSNNIEIVMSNNKIDISAAKIQRKWRSQYLIKRFKTTQKEKLIAECDEFINKQYELCDKDGQIIINDFDQSGWQQFYKNTDFYFNPNTKFIKLKKAIKITNPNNPLNISIYEGEVNIKNQKHGFGMLTTPNMVYIGNWENDKFTGWGRITKRNGLILEGKYYNGVLEGKGIVKNGKGGIYCGDFRNSKRHGKGVLETKNIHYEGDFWEDKISGHGNIFFKKEGHNFEGEFLENEINGFGIFKWKSGDYYVGEMKNGKMNGKGKYVSKNGNVFLGKYVKGIRQPGGVEFKLGDESKKI